MTALTDNMTFGTFMAPFHRVDENPTLALERDLELIEWLDDLGFDEAWIVLPKNPFIRSLLETSEQKGRVRCL